jgi:hypothetical protein
MMLFSDRTGASSTDSSTCEDLRQLDERAAIGPHGPDLVAATSTTLTTSRAANVVKKVIRASSDSVARSAAPSDPVSTRQDGLGAGLHGRQQLGEPNQRAHERSSIPRQGTIGGPDLQLEVMD